MVCGYLNRTFVHVREDVGETNKVVKSSLLQMLSTYHEAYSLRSRKEGWFEGINYQISSFALLPMYYGYSWLQDLVFLLAAGLRQDSL